VHDRIYCENKLNFAKKTYAQNKKIKKVKLLKPIVSQHEIQNASLTILPLMSRGEREESSPRAQFSRLGHAENATERNSAREEVEDFEDIRPVMVDSSFVSKLTDEL